VMWGGKALRAIVSLKMAGTRTRRVFCANDPGSDVSSRVGKGAPRRAG